MRLQDAAWVTAVHTTACTNSDEVRQHVQGTATAGMPRQPHAMSNVH